MKQELWLPFPPTSNTMYGLHGHRRFVSDAYAIWKEHAMGHLMGQKPTKMDGCVAIHISLTAPTKRKWDVDNRVKPILDLLVTCNIIEDDNAEIVRRITVEAVDGPPGATITLEAIA